MAVRIRLKRMGRRHRVAYRLAAVDGRRTRDSRVIEELGNIDPLNSDRPGSIQINHERVKYWLGVGAQPSDTVRRLLEKQGVVEATEPKKR